MLHKQGYYEMEAPGMTTNPKTHFSTSHNDIGEYYRLFSYKNIHKINLTRGIIAY